MALKKLSQNGVAQDAPTYKLFINDEVVEEAIPVLGITVYRAFNRISTAKIVIKDGTIGGGKSKKTDFSTQNKTTFQPGNKIEIKIGHRGNNNYSVFKGIITGQLIRIRRATTKLIVECKSEAFRMTLQNKCRYFTESTDSDIMADLIQDYGLSFDVEDTPLEHPELVQYECSDWHFLVNRAEHNGLFVWIDEQEQVKVKKLDFRQEPKNILEYGNNIYELDAEMDARLQFEGVKVQSWDYAEQSIVEQEAVPPAVNAQGNLSGETLAAVGNDGQKTIRHSGYKLDGELQAKADALLLRDRIAKIRGRARIKTAAKISPGDIFDLRSLGERFSGLALVSAVRYEYGKSWMVDVQFGFSNEWKLEQDQAKNAVAPTSFLPGVSGLQIGLVSQIHDDPEASNRIKVRLPLIDNTEEGVWARIAALDAGEKRGSFFMPEEDDEVVVGFINDDPKEAIVLGMLHSSAKPPPLTANEKNSQKGFFSREGGMKILFDDEKNTLTIETKGGNKLILSDADKKIVLQTGGGNKLEINDDSGVILGDPSNDTKILGQRIDLNE